MARNRKLLTGFQRLLGLLLAAIFAVAGAGPRSSASVLAAVPESEPAASSPQAEVAASAQQAVMLTSNIQLRVESARTESNWDGGGEITIGTEVTEYKWLISVDNTGDPFDAGDGISYDPASGGDYVPDPNCLPYDINDPSRTIPNPNYTQGCEWPGLRTVPGWAPIYASGDQTDIAAGLSLDPGKYLISIVADNFRIDGEHFSIPMVDEGGDGVETITVPVHPLPLPPAKVTVMVFDDAAMTNGQHDGVSEAGLAGFRASLNDTMGEITVDLFGNPLCTEYEKNADGTTKLDAEGAPVILKLGGGCYSDETGLLEIPNVGPLRYDVLVIPPDGTDWVQTTTLEGSQGWDTWLQEGGTGLDNEFVIAGEPFPWTIFGFVSPTESVVPMRTVDASQKGAVKGVVMVGNVYTPFTGGLPFQGDIWGGLMGVKLMRPVSDAWIALNDLQNGDQAVWVGMVSPDGSFFIPDVPEGNYFMSYWDQKQHFILDWTQFAVHGGETTDTGIRTLTGWFSEVTGHVFHDYNENGKFDDGEPGVPNYAVILKDRDNTEIDRMTIVAVTDATGYYAMEKVYPMSSWMVLEAYSDLYKTTGVTYQTSNQPTETTILEPMVDMGILPILGQSGRLDWGVKFYGPNENGGIAGTVSYDTMRAEDEARYAGAEPYQPGIPDLVVNLYATEKDANGNFKKASDGSYLKGKLLNTTVTETFERPSGCIPRDVNGNPQLPTDMLTALGDWTTLQLPCLEGPMMGLQFGSGQNALDGNYGFSEGCFTGTLNATDPLSPVCDGGAFETLTVGDYLVEVVVPVDELTGNPKIKVTREEDLNMFGGNTFTPAIPPPACAGALHTVDVADGVNDNYPEKTILDPSGVTITVPGSTPTENPGYVEAGGSRYEGKQMPLCDVKLATVVNGKGIAPVFTFFSDVPIPGKWKGYIINDLDLSNDPFELFFGEKAGMHYMPIGVYDYTGRLVHTIISDFHGVYEVLLPSTNTFNAPTPSGMTAGVYYIYGNDPGPVGSPNPTYTPQFRSIGTSFEVYPGVIVPSDLAPVTNGALIQNPTSNVVQPAACRVALDEPQFFAVDVPYVDATRRTFTIFGEAFGTAEGRVELNGDRIRVTSWTNRQIDVEVQEDFVPGDYQMTIEAANGLESVNGLTIHVLGTGYNPTVYEVGTGKAYDPADYPINDYNYEGTGPIQAAIDAAYADAGNALVVVYPGLQPAITERPMYLENPVIYEPIKLQGVGPGGTYANNERVDGTVLDGRGVGGDTMYTTWWRTSLIPEIWNNRGGWDGGLPPEADTGIPFVYEGAVITVFSEDGEFTGEFEASIDGFTIQGGDQQGFPNNLNQITGEAIPGVQAEVVVQGGGVFANAYANYLQIANNIFSSNGGAYGGAIRIGTPHLAGELNDNQNDNIFIGYNRIIANGGTNLAGGIGLFAGSQNYEVAYNDICGNFSSEYGGGISHYGLSPDGQIHHNRIYYNRSYDEGAGIMIAGELSANPAVLSTGAGPVEIYNNLIQGNLANDDGGGLRFLMSGDFEYNVYNNIIANNISTHEGGGISINDAPNVSIIGNTIVKNITTATAMTSTGDPAPAGLSTSLNSNLLQQTLPGGAPVFSTPFMFNNIFWDNRAGAWNGDGVVGIGLPNDPIPVNYWDFGVADNFGTLQTAYTLMQVPYGTFDPTNIIGIDPLFVDPINVSVRVLPWRGNPNFVGANLVTFELPDARGIPGDYHLQATSPAREMGARRYNNVNANNRDYDDEPRNSYGAYEIGADELRVPYPSTNVLFAVQTAAPAAIEPSANTQVLPFKVFLPVTMGGTGSVTPPPASNITDSFIGLEENFEVAGGSVVPVTSGHMLWKNAEFGASQEAYFTFKQICQVSERQGLILKATGLEADGSIGNGTSLLAVSYLAANETINVEMLSPGKVWSTLAVIRNVSLVSGDILGARASEVGILDVYQNNILLSSIDLDPSLEMNQNGGKIGVLFEGTFTSADQAGFDLFGGGTMPVQ
ncbi:MAG: hypothetical protein EHM41_02845 [Chloroflexi bacterium]|nr:MAG: hypothetical protein EHM41_02845 [Chloroflexota bacterium]